MGHIKEVNSMNSVYISGALMNAVDLSRSRILYEQLAHACICAGYTAYLPHQNTDPEEMSEISAEVVMQRDMDELNKASVLVAYIGEPSLGVGAEIAIAMQQEKTILAVYDSANRVSRFILGLLAKYPHGSVFAYDSVAGACNWVTTTLKASSALSDCA
jgi:nucleoside 2-deoxyribosyltransferase